tara:strand:+ start:545 stop:1105 length:561 start_codon:yes stop_codon:yes gene_type:complete
MVAAIILAAGASQRMGSPKALLPIADSTLLQRILEVVKKTCNEIVIVTRKELQVDIMLNAPESRIVTNPMPENGRTGTLQVGLLALEIPTAALIVPVDRPGFTIETIEALLKAGGCARPVHDGKGGHPVLLDREAIRKVMAAEANESLREILQFSDVQVEGVDFSLNVDRPEDLQKLTQWYVSQDT